jgi:hypothetical protein
MDFKSVFSNLTSGKQGDKYLYTDPEIKDQENIVDSLKKSGVDPSIITAQEAQLAKMQSRRQQPKNESDFPTSMDFLKEQAPAFASGIDTPPSPAPMLPPSPIPSPMETKAPMGGMPTSSGTPKIDLSIPGPDKDQAAREALDREQKKMTLGKLFPQALAGFGDMVTAAGAPYGTKQTAGFENIKEKQKEQGTEAKAELEKKFLNDPNSSASKAAQSAAARLLGKKPEEMANFSLAQIDKSFPIWKEALNNEEARELKKLQLEYLKESKASRQAQSNADTQNNLEKQERDRLDKISSIRSGGLGLQDQKVNQSVHMLNLMDQYKDPMGNYNVPPAQYEELAIGLANLISGSNTATESMIKGIKQKTAAGDLNGALTYVTGKNFNGSTQDILKNLRHTIERQGTVAETQRDKYMKDFIDTAPKELEKDRLNRLASVARGTSVKDYLSKSQPQDQSNSPMTIMKDPKTGKRYQVDPTTKQVIKEVL